MWLVRLHLYISSFAYLSAVAYVDVGMRTPITYGNESLSVVCEPHAAYKGSIERIEMIRVYVEWDGAKLGTMQSKLARIMRKNGSDVLQKGPAKTDRYIITGNMSTVDAAYLRVHVSASNVMCSDSRLFRCEMQFIFKNKTRADDVSDRATCVQGPCNKCEVGPQNFVESTDKQTDEMGKTMKDPLFLASVGLAVIGFLCLVAGLTLIVVIKKEQKARSNGNPIAVCNSQDNAACYAELDDVQDVNRNNNDYVATMQRKQEENMYSALKI